MRLGDRSPKYDLLPTRAHVMCVLCARPAFSVFILYVQVLLTVIAQHENAYGRNHILLTLCCRLRFTRTALTILLYNIHSPCLSGWIYFPTSNHDEGSFAQECCFLGELYPQR